MQRAMQADRWGAMGRMLDMGLTTPEEEMREKRGSGRPRIAKAEQRHAFTGDAVWAWWWASG